MNRRGREERIGGQNMAGAVDNGDGKEKIRVELSRFDGGRAAGRSDSGKMAGSSASRFGFRLQTTQAKGSCFGANKAVSL